MGVKGGGGAWLIHAPPHPQIRDVRSFFQLSGVTGPKSVFCHISANNTPIQANFVLFYFSYLAHNCQIKLEFLKPLKKIR